MQTLYRKLGHLNGVDISNKPHYNLDDWLNPESQSYRHDLSDAVFHYSPHTSEAQHLEVCIMTEEMRDAAWCYIHQKQLIFDGTFGVVSSQMLLFIALGVDESGKGIPVAFFLFSAPSGNQVMHAGYDSSILQQLLSK